MIIKKTLTLLLFFFLFFLSISCNQSQKEQSSRKETKEIINKKSNSFSLLNKLYLLAPEFNLEKCESFAECDCCASHYVFLDSENFISVDYCLEVDMFYSGKYKIKKDTIELDYNSTAVKKEYNWESETDTTNTQPKYFYKIEKCKPFKSKWVRFKCKEKNCFKTIETETDYASVDKTKRMEIFLADIKKEGILDKLHLK